MMTKTTKKFLARTEVLSEENATRCTVRDVKTGEQVYTIKFNATPTESQLSMGVAMMMEDNGIPDDFFGAIRRQVESAVVFKMKALEVES